jgi:hypothetical protein
MLHPKNKSHDSICAKHVDADLVNSPVNIKPVNTNPVDAEGLAEGLEEFGPKVKENDA